MEINVTTVGDMGTSPESAHRKGRGKERETRKGRKVKERARIKGIRDRQLSKGILKGKQKEVVREEKLGKDTKGCGTTTQQGGIPRALLEVWGDWTQGE